MTSALKRIAPIYCFNANRWGDPWWVDRTHLMYRLALRGWPVTYSYGPLSIWDRGTKKWDQSTWMSNVEKLDLPNGRHLLIDRPGKLSCSWPKWQVWDDAVVRLHGRRLTRQMRDQAYSDRIAFVCFPTFMRHAKAVRATRVVLHVFDAWRDNHWWTPELDRLLNELVDRADLITALTKEQANTLPGDGPKRARVLPHGVDADVFKSALREKCPSDLVEIPEPRIGYFGRISQKIDLELILSLASKRPEWNWVFIGLDFGLKGTPSEILWQKICDRPNVHALGFKVSNLVPTYMCNMSVLTLPFKSSGTGYWNSIFSLKTYEYLATGLAIVGSKVANVDRMSEVIASAASLEEWESELERAIHTGGAGTRESRQKIAFDYENSWEKRTDDLQAWLTEFL